MSKKTKIFVVDDDLPVTSMLCMFIQQQGFTDVTALYSVEELLARIPIGQPAIIVQDFDFPGLSGLDAIKRIKPKYPGIEFIFLSGQQNINVAIEAIRQGAFDYIVKDSFAKENVVIKIRNLLHTKELEKKRTRFRFLLLVLTGLALVGWLLALVLYLSGT